jgi:hypothetical protein
VTGLGLVADRWFFVVGRVISSVFLVARQLQNRMDGVKVLRRGEKD